MEYYISIWNKNNIWTKTIRKNISNLLEWFGYDDELFSLFKKPEDIINTASSLFLYFQRWNWKWLKKITNQDLEEIIEIDNMYKEYLNLSKQIYFPVIENKKIWAMSYKKFKQAILWNIDFEELYLEDIIYDWYKCTFIWFRHNKEKQLCIVLSKKHNRELFLVEDIENIIF